MKLLIIGYGRHGKDTFAELLAHDLGTTFTSSSLFVAAAAVRPALEDIGVVYDSIEECYEDRVNHRAFWKWAISEYNTPKDRMAKAILAEHDMYVGLRARDEFEAVKGLFDYIVWVDRSEHLPPEPVDSNELTAEDADEVIDNNGDLYDLDKKAYMLAQDLKRLFGEKGASFG